MIDHAALSTGTFRSEPFLLGNDLSYHWEGMTHGGATLIRTRERLFCGRVYPKDGMWIIERTCGDHDERRFYSVDAAMLTLAADIAERNVEYANNMRTWESLRDAG